MAFKHWWWNWEWNELLNHFSQPVNRPIFQIEKDYEKFRAARGLPPVKGFFTTPPQVKTMKLCGPLSSQLEYLSKTADDETPKLSLINRPFPTPKTLAFTRSTWQRASLGLTAAIVDKRDNGVVQRNAIQSPDVSALGIFD